MTSPPLPQETLLGGSSGSFRAFTTLPLQSQTGAQITRLGQAVQSAGTATANIADVLQDDLDTARTKEATALWLDENRVTLYDPQEGYLNTSGKSATGDARKNAQNQIARNAQNLSKRLDNDDQRTMFAIAVQEKMLQINQALDQHENRGARVFNIGETKALSEELASDAVEFRTQAVPNLLDFEKNKQSAIIEARTVADLLEYGPEQTEAFILDTTTSIHAGVVGRLLAEMRDVEAGDYLRSVDENEIDSNVLTRLKDEIGRAEFNERATTSALDIVARIDQQGPGQQTVQGPGSPIVTSPGVIGPPAAAQTVSQDPTVQGPPAPNQVAVGIADESRMVGLALTELNLAVKDGTMSAEEADATLDRVKEIAQSRRNVRVENTNEIVRQAELWLIDNPGKRPSQIQPPSLYEALRTSGELPSINAFSASTNRYTTNDVTYANVLNMPRSTLRKLSDGDFHLLFRGQMNNQDLERAKAYHKSTRGESTLGDDTDFTRVERIREAAIAAEIMTRGTSDPVQLTRFSRFDREINRRVATAKREGLPFKGEFLQKIIDGVTMDVVMTPDSFILDEFAADDVRILSTLSEEERRFAFIRLDVGDIRLANLPSQVRAELVLKLREAGRPTNEANIIDLWADTGAVKTVAELERLEEEQTIDIFRDSPSLPGTTSGVLRQFAPGRSRKKTRPRIGGTRGGSIR